MVASVRRAEAQQYPQLVRVREVEWNWPRLVLLPVPVTQQGTKVPTERHLCKQQRGKKIWVETIGVESADILAASPLIRARRQAMKVCYWLLLFRSGKNSEAEKGNPLTAAETTAGAMGGAKAA
eukprot:CAMPEP_0206486900 /NCGR_PEP_ID=MMETSP0324_2-20121206/41299_1 /ASSEMBLY_ACC=CAM_ASM_000836 /TAXON_ID=2866 /ORGANISM="Crypthecodinium cohnii, Strain Seligo" /LENGTH=123 /DNA_ID=CAMNT_0053965235 /DNA_START=478 /DNA_END=844 /DNA_ORIENTATION=+